MPLAYDKFPPTANDVRVAPIDIVDRVMDTVIASTIGEEDAHRLAIDMAPDDQGMLDLAEVRRGLTLGSSALSQEAQISYLSGVEKYIQTNLKAAKSAGIAS